MYISLYLRCINSLQLFTHTHLLLFYYFLLVVKIFTIVKSTKGNNVLCNLLHYKENELISVTAFTCLAKKSFNLKLNIICILLWVIKSLFRLRWFVSRVMKLILTFSLYTYIISIFILFIKQKKIKYHSTHISQILMLYKYSLKEFCSHPSFNKFPQYLLIAPVVSFTLT